jgi:hypothetical protein
MLGGTLSVTGAVVGVRGMLALFPLGSLPLQRDPPTFGAGLRRWALVIVCGLIRSKLSSSGSRGRSLGSMRVGYTVLELDA